MNSLRNSVRIYGNLGSNPEIRKTETEKDLVRFSVATNESYKNSDGVKVTAVQWHSCICWGKLAQIAAKYLSKGSEVLLEGKLINRNYTDKEGIKRYLTEIQVSELLMLGSGKQASDENILPFDKDEHKEDEEVEEETELNPVELESQEK